MSSVLVFWMGDQKTSIVKLQNVPEGDREPGKVANVLWQDGQSYPAQIVKVAKCTKTLEIAEKKFLEKYNALSKGSSKRASKSKQVYGEAEASAMQVAKALGEHVKLPPQQAAEKAQIARQKKVDNANARQVESTSDTVAFQSSNVSTVKRNLICNLFDATPASTRVSVVEDTTSSQVGSSPIRNEEFSSPVKDTCEKCRNLYSHINPSSMEFLIALSKFCQMEPTSLETNFNHSAFTEREGMGEASHLQPLPVQSGHKKVELTVGSGIFLQKSSKAKAVYSSGGDPEKLTREILIVLYGDRLKQPGISALGYGKKKLGIGENDLQNIFSFVCRNTNIKGRTDKKGNQLPPFNYNLFIKVVNKKLKSASRDRSHSRSNSVTKNSEKGPESPLGTAMGTPAKTLTVNDQPITPDTPKSAQRAGLSGTPYTQRAGLPQVAPGPAYATWYDGCYDQSSSQAPGPAAYTSWYGQAPQQSHQYYGQHPSSSYNSGIPLMDTQTLLQL